jgi:hypothetical protein
MDWADSERPVSLPAAVVQRLPEWRRRHQNLIFIPKWETVLRPVTRGEVVDFERNSVSDLLWAQIGLFRTCLLYPLEWQAFADSISISGFQSAFDALYRESGFRDPQSFDRDLHVWRVQVLERDHAVIRHICRAFSQFTDTDVNDMPRARILYLLAQAECILGMTYDGQELAKLQETWIAEAQRQQIKDRAAQIRSGQVARRRTFSVEDDVKVRSRADTDVSDVDMGIDQWRERNAR